ncbi:MAG TPA: PEGA domain-containing protein [Bacteroidota bacterium]
MIKNKTTVILNEVPVLSGRSEESHGLYTSNTEIPRRFCIKRNAPRNDIKFLRFLFLIFVVTNATFAQTGKLTVESKPSGAAVYVDSVLVGATPLQRYELRAGSHVLRLSYPSATSWMSVSKKETVEVAADSDVRYTYELGSLLTINSKPSGATVTLHSRELGTTPLFYRTAGPLSGTLLLKKEGYEPNALALTAEMPVPPLIMLKPLSPDMEERFPDVLPPEYEGNSSPRWLTYVAASSMVVGSVLSAYWKDKANGEFNRYVATRDPVFLASTQRLDHRSGIAITISHVSFAALAYLLLSE